jgi:hypothetical protein
VNRGRVFGEVMGISGETRRWVESSIGQVLRRIYSLQDASGGILADLAIFPPVPYIGPSIGTDINSIPLVSNNLNGHKIDATHGMQRRGRKIVPEGFRCQQQPSKPRKWLEMGMNESRAMTGRWKRSKT